MRASASLFFFATALTSFSGVSGSVIPHPPPTESDLVDVNEPPPFRVGVPVSAPVPANTIEGEFDLISPLPFPSLSILRDVNDISTIPGAQGKHQTHRLNNRRHTTNDPNRDMGMRLPRDPADGENKLPDRPGN